MDRPLQVLVPNISRRGVNIRFGGIDSDETGFLSTIPGRHPPCADIARPGKRLFEASQSFFSQLERTKGLFHITQAGLSPCREGRAKAIALFQDKIILGGSLVWSGGGCAIGGIDFSLGGNLLSQNKNSQRQCSDFPA